MWGACCSLVYASRHWVNGKQGMENFILPQCCVVIVCTSLRPPACRCMTIWTLRTPDQFLIKSVLSPVPLSLGSLLLKLPLGCKHTGNCNVCFGAFFFVAVWSCCDFSNVISHFVLWENSDKDIHLLATYNPCLRCSRSGSELGVKCLHMWLLFFVFLWWLHWKIMLVHQSLCCRQKKWSLRNISTIDVWSTSRACQKSQAHETMYLKRSFEIDTDRHTHKQPWASPSAHFTRLPINLFPPSSNIYIV